MSYLLVQYYTSSIYGCINIWRLRNCALEDCKYHGGTDSMFNCSWKYCNLNIISRTTGQNITLTSIHCSFSYIQNIGISNTFSKKIKPYNVWHPSKKINFWLHTKRYLNYDSATLLTTGPRMGLFVLMLALSNT